MILSLAANFFRLNILKRDLEKRNFRMPWLHLCDMCISSALTLEEQIHLLICCLFRALQSWLQVGPLDILKSLVALKSGMS